MKKIWSIKFGGFDINTLNKKFIRDNIAIVNQFPYLFNLSIRDNFRIINSNITDKEIYDLCDKVLMKEYITNLPNGLNSVICEGGCQLSGGQRQKLCIARALCRNVKVMIFDSVIKDIKYYLCFITARSVIYYVKILNDCKYSDELLDKFYIRLKKLCDYDILGLNLINKEDVRKNEFIW